MSALGDKIRGAAGVYPEARVISPDEHLLTLAIEVDELAKSNDLLADAILADADVRAELHEEIDSLKTTLTEDLAYQEKLEAKIERVRAYAARLRRSATTSPDPLRAAYPVLLTATQIEEALADVPAPEPHYVTEDSE